MSNKIKIARGTKARIETVKNNLDNYEIVYATDTDELGVKKPDGDVKYIGSDGSGGGIDLDEILYMNHASKIFYDSGKENQFKGAWEHSLTVDTLDISENSTPVNKRGTAQYPNGETEGVIIPQGVTSIGQLAFADWTSNNQPLVIPNSITSIGGSAFYSWTSNNQPLVIPNSVTNIGNSAFNGWTANNKPLVIPNSVTSIGVNAFQNWIKVPYVEMKSETPPTLNNYNAFSGQNSAPIYVPDESVELYRTATNWSMIRSRIFPISDRTQKEIDYIIIQNQDTSEIQKLRLYVVGGQIGYEIEEE